MQEVTAGHEADARCMLHEMTERMLRVYTVEDTIRSFILSEFLPGEDASQLTEATPLITTGILDSIATIKLIAFLEQQFSIAMAAYEVDVAHLDTISSMARFVRSKR